MHSKIRIEFENCIRIIGLVRLLKIKTNKTLLNARIQKYGKKQSKYELIFRSCLTRFHERRGLG
jgi:hypothetical protein